MTNKIILALIVVSLPLQAATLSSPYIAVDHVTCWPNLLLLPNGHMLVIGFDKPSHGQVEGDVSCWISEDEGATWQYQSTLTQHDPNTNRMNHAVGLTTEGYIIVLVSGWSNIQQPGKEKKDSFRDKMLDFWTCLSKDNGKTWTVLKDGFVTAPNGGAMVPFGDIFTADDGTLRASVYSANRAYMIFSSDLGKSWHIKSVIGQDMNETAILHLGKGTWLAAARLNGLTLYRSMDDGKTWQKESEVTAPNQHPGHFLRLNDGRILLSYGNRKKGEMGVCAKFSSDDGKTWSKPVAIASMHMWDGGYPESIELSEQNFLTVYYGKKATDTKDYAVYGVKWDIPKDIK